MTELTLYLTTYECYECRVEMTYAHEGPRVPIDMEAPKPNVTNCPNCTAVYAPTRDIVEVREGNVIEKPEGYHD